MNTLRGHFSKKRLLNENITNGFGFCEVEDGCEGERIKDVAI